MRRPPPPLVTPAALTVPQALNRAAWLTPGLDALVAGEERITFAALEVKSKRLAQSLSALGVSPGSRVALCLGNSVRWVALFLALARIGAVTVPINTRLKSAEIAFVLHDADVRFAVFADAVLSSNFAAMMPDIRAAAPALQTVVMTGTGGESAIGWDAFKGGEAALPGLPDAADDLLIQYTSGTTAFPKAVPLTHQQMLTNAYVSGQRLGLRAGDRLHSARPFFHVAGTTLSILSCLHHQATLVTMERFEAGAALAQMEAERCTHFAGNGTMATMLLDHPDRTNHDLVLRGAWLAASPAQIKRVVEELGARETVSGYGLSEASPNVAQSAWWDEEAVRTAGFMTPQPGLEVRIGGKLLNKRGRGEIEVRGWSVMSGYLGRPDETAKAVSADGWLRTGDLGESDGDGRFRFVGRLKEMLRVGGENVSPADVEAMLVTHPDIAWAEVVAVPDKRLGEVPVAFCVSNADPQDLCDWANSQMAGFKAPRRIWCVPNTQALGLNASGKVSKKLLSQRAVELLEAALQ